jgi:hypothetical protein
VFDQGERSDILDAIVAEGRCGTCAEHEAKLWAGATSLAIVENG